MKQIIIHRNIPRDCYLKLSVKRGGSLDQAPQEKQVETARRTGKTADINQRQNSQDKSTTI
jgi:hypothetical protein